jgi:hypothetical protein
MSGGATAASVPSYQDLLWPTLQAVRANGDSATIEEMLRVMTPAVSGTSASIGWARDTPRTTNPRSPALRPYLASNSRRSLQMVVGPL